MTECEEKIRLTAEQKQAIVDMREHGMTFARIAGILNLSCNTVKSYHRREMRKRELAKEREKLDATKYFFCLYCGKKLRQRPKQKKRLYCDVRCRDNYWNRNRDALKHKVPSRMPCAYCRKEFSTHGRQSRKYCSRECYAYARWGVPDAN